MTLTRGRLYLLLLTACVAGYTWLYWANVYGIHLPEVCLIKRFAGIPCPSCCTTRAIGSLLKGHFTEAFYRNPLSLLIFPALITVPLLIVVDIILKKDYLLRSYNFMEITFRKKPFALPAIALLLFNWIWNITKGN